MKTNRQDAPLILRLLVEDRFPRPDRTVRIPPVALAGMADKGQTSER
jgi:hypothetical protein